jgi:heme A synthase
MSIVSMIHRILGETLLLIALVGVILAIVGLVRKKEMEKAERIFGLAYAGLLDLQALLGIVQFIYLLSIAGTPLLLSRFIWHPVLMILAVFVVHGSRKARSSQIPARYRAQLIAYGLSLVLIFAGRMIVA